MRHEAAVMTGTDVTAAVTGSAIGTVIASEIGIVGIGVVTTDAIEAVAVAAVAGVAAVPPPIGVIGDERGEAKCIALMQAIVVSFLTA